MLGAHAMHALDGAIARDLVRVSHDPNGREKSPDDQHSAHKRSAKANGWKLVGPSYRDLVSASKFGPDERADFERLITDLETNRFNARVLMMWENSRGSRRESEWIKLIELADLRGVVFWIDARGRVMDPKNPHDRRDLVHAAADAAYESGLISERTCRGVRESASEGAPHGRLPYGYLRIYDKTGAFVEQLPDPDEAPVVRDLFKRVAAGQSIRGVAEAFRKKGIEKRSGGPFSPAHLRSILTNPTYAGIRVHDPDRRSGRSKLGPNARQIKGAWRALVTLKRFEDVQRLLSDPERKTTRPGGARHLLSMIARCSVCGSVVAVRKNRTPGGPPRYACHSARGCALMDKADLDQFAVKLILTWLGDPECYGVLGRADAAANERLAVVRADLEKAIADRDELAERVGRNEPGFTLAFSAKAAPLIEERIAKLEAEERALRPSILEGLIEPGPDVAKRWSALTLDSQRRVARLLLVPEYVGELRIKPAGRGPRKVPKPLLERVQVVRKKVA